MILFPLLPVADESRPVSRAYEREKLRNIRIVLVRKFTIRIISYAIYISRFSSFSFNTNTRTSK
jgi:hypothetical protein